MTEYFDLRILGRESTRNEISSPVAERSRSSVSVAAFDRIVLQEAGRYQLVVESGFVKQLRDLENVVEERSSVARALLGDVGLGRQPVGAREHRRLGDAERGTVASGPEATSCSIGRLPS